MTQRKCRDGKNKYTDKDLAINVEIKDNPDPARKACHPQQVGNDVAKEHQGMGNTGIDRLVSCKMRYVIDLPDRSQDKNDPKKYNAIRDLSQRKLLSNKTSTLISTLHRQQPLPSMMTAGVVS